MIMNEPPTGNLLAEVTHCRSIEQQIPMSLPAYVQCPTPQLERTFFMPTPLDGFPHIHQATPTQVLDNFPTDTLKRWLESLGFKAIARIFDYDNTSYRSHFLPKAILAMALAAATANLAPNSPAPTCIPPPVRPSGPPSPCMLVSIPSEQAQQALLNGRIWSSEWITFEILPPTVHLRPTALFAIGPFPRDDPTPPGIFLREAWTSPQNETRIAESLISSNEPELRAGDVIDHMLRTLALHPFPYPGARGFGFVVHISSWWSEIEHWANVKKTLLSLEYAPPSGQGEPLISTLPYCSICHSVDHTRTTCPFPNLPLWKGPR